jgi:hypothetical protein
MNAPLLPSDELRAAAQAMARQPTNAAWMLLRAARPLLTGAEADVVGLLAELLTTGANRFGDMAMVWEEIATHAQRERDECNEIERGFAA